METIRLVEGIRRRSESAFREVYDNYFKLLKHVVYKMVNNHQIADELVQETFMKMYERIHTYTVDTNFKFWLVQIAKNTALDYLRKEQKQLNITVNEDAVENYIDDQKPDDYDHLYKKIEKIVSKDEYEIVILRIFHGLKFHEIAAMLEITTAVATNKYSRAIKKLKKELREEDLHE
jgi:RNA polymerase sigma-70 factor, ECF subfamily